MERGQIAQARTLLRSALETLFALSAISKKPETVDRILEGYTAEQQRVAENMSKWSDPALKEIAEGEGAICKRAPHLNGTAARISAYELARRAGLEDWYLTVYNVFSWSAHGALKDLERHIVADQAGNMIQFRSEPEIENQESPWLCASEVLLKALEAMDPIFGGVRTAAVIELYAETKRLYMP